jgi:magnesium transporter
MLINCVAYQEGRKLADIELEEIHAYVARPDCFVWVALADPSDAELAAMQGEFRLHELAVEDAGHRHETVARPKVEEYGDLLFVVMNTVELTPTDEIKLGEMSVFVGPNYALSVRRRAERGFREVRANAERHPELLRRGPGFVLYALMDAVVDRYFPVLEAIEMELEAVEGRLFERGAPPRENIESLYYVKQQLTTVKHAAGPLLENAGKLFGGRVPPACAGLGEYFRDVYDHLVRINQSIDAAREIVGTGIQVALAMVATRQGEITRMLAAYAALVAVPTMIAGIYGMNFEHMPELEWRFGYPLVLGVIVAIDAFLFSRFRKAGWL